MELDPGGASDDRKLIGFGCFGPSDNVSDWIANRLAEGRTGIVGWGVFCRPDQFSRNRYVDDNICLFVRCLPPSFYTMSSHGDNYTYQC
jgi:hypothetical protein